MKPFSLSLKYVTHVWNMSSALYKIKWSGRKFIFAQKRNQI